MSSAVSSFLERGKALLSGRANEPDMGPRGDHGFRKAPDETSLFPKTDSRVDGEEDCDHDCETCVVQYPKKWSIDEDEKLYGKVNGWSTHILIATGKTDWVKDVADEKGSVMQAIRDCGIEPSNGKLMLSASNMPIPSHPDDSTPYLAPTTALLLPAFTFIDDITPASVPTLIEYISTSRTTTTPLPPPSSNTSAALTTPATPLSLSSPPLPSAPSPIKTRPCPHLALILLCSQKTRDTRCGQSAPLLAREFARHLQPLGLYRDIHDQRPGGVGIYFISHVGGHKFSANVMVYRREGLTYPGESGNQGHKEGDGKEVPENEKGGGGKEASQCIWLARVRPEDCEGIIKYTVLKGKVVKPERQLRGGWDRGRGLVSW